MPENKSKNAKKANKPLLRSLVWPTDRRSHSHNFAMFFFGGEDCAGFSTAFQACCGSGGGKYNYQNSARCGMSGAYACSNPAAHLSWDGIHLTEAAYKQITDGWLNGPYCRPAIV
jgi:hypothetical protein